MRGLLPTQVRADRLLAHRDGRRDLPRIRPHGDREVLADAGRRPPLAGVRTDACTTRPAASTTTRFHVLGRRLEAIDAAHGTGGQPGLLPLDAGELLPGDRAVGWAATKLNKPPGFARVVIEKPFGHDLASARELADDRPPAVLREPDLPDRPLPGQGDRPEHLRVPVRQHDLRAGLEQHATSTTCSSRSASRSASSTGRPSTRRPASSATSCRTTCFRCSRWWRWSRRRRSTPTPIRDEKAKLLRATRPMTLRELGARPVRRRATSPASRPWRTSRSRTSRPTRTRRPTSRRSSRSTTGAGRGRPSTSGPASGWPSG